jgi:hypothetical protein
MKTRRLFFWYRVKSLSEISRLVLDAATRLHRRRIGVRPDGEIVGFPEHISQVCTQYEKARQGCQKTKPK